MVKILIQKKKEYSENFYSKYLFNAPKHHITRPSDADLFLPIKLLIGKCYSYLLCRYPALVV